VRPLVGFASALALDASARDGLGDDLLMEAAAVGMAAAIDADPALRKAAASGSPSIAAVCGGGNNAGDALAVLRRLAFSGWKDLVALVPDSLGPLASRRLAEAGLAGARVIGLGDDAAHEAVARAGVVLDGLSGVGFKGPARAALVQAAALIASARGPVVSMDVPSGVGALGSVAADPSAPVCADITLCVEPLKAELYYPGFRPYAGRILPIGGVFDRSAGAASTMVLLEPGDLEDALPGLDPDCHKGDRGAVCAFAGSYGSTGAAVLCSRAAAAAGAGSVTLLARDELVPMLSTMLVAQMVRPESDPGTRRFTAALAGPGWGADERNAARLESLWDAALPLALDADALGLLVTSCLARRCSPLLLTPHPGEFAPLAAVAAGAQPDDPAALELAARRTRFDTAAVVAETAAYFGAVVALKGSVTWIGDPDGRLAVWDGREPALATAGSGDVLAGLAAGFLARGASAWDAAKAAVIAHGLAGRALARRGFFEADALLPEVARLSYGRGINGNQG